MLQVIIQRVECYHFTRRYIKMNGSLQLIGTYGINFCIVLNIAFEIAQ